MLTVKEWRELAELHWRLATTASDPNIALSHLVLAANAQAKATGLEDRIRGESATEAGSAGQREPDGPGLGSRRDRRR